MNALPGRRAHDRAILANEVGTLCDHEFIFRSGLGDDAGQTKANIPARRFTHAEHGATTYAVNLIAEDRAAELVEGTRLDRWIGDKPGRGRLDVIGGDRKLWSLSDQELFDVRPVLNAAGLLLSGPNRIYRDLPTRAHA